jgi:hypothetical protein
MSAEWQIEVQIPEGASPAEEQRIIDAAIARETARVEKSVADTLGKLFK